MTRAAAFFERGWTGFAPDPALADWVRAAAPVAARVAADPAQRARWLRCGGAWFAGVNALDNDARGAVAGGPPLSGAPMDFAARDLGLGPIALDRAQVSVCYPGYPQPWEGETEAAFGFRLKRDAAHVDGLRPVGAARRRVIGERHGFVLGLPLNAADPGAAPLVVWEGSHEVIRAALRAALAGRAPADWGAADITEAYKAARRVCFDTLPRVEVTARPGAAYMLHRLTLHGVAPWRAPAADPRMIAYFRPEPDRPPDSDWWLADP